MAQPDPIPFNQGKALELDEVDQQPDFSMLDDIKVPDANDDDGQENLQDSDENNRRQDASPLQNPFKKVKRQSTEEDANVSEDMVNDEDKIKPVVQHDKPSIGKFSNKLQTTASTQAEDKQSTMIEANKGQ